MGARSDWQHRRALTAKEKVGIVMAVLAVAVVGAVVADVYGRLTTGPAKPRVDEFEPVEADEHFPPLTNQPRFAGLIFPESGGDPGAPPSPMDEDLVKWGADLGADLPSDTGFVLDVTAPSGTVAITGITPRAVDRSPAEAGYHVPPSGAGDFRRRALFIDLDADPITYQEYSDLEDWSFPISMGKDDHSLIELIGRTERSRVEWVVDIDYIVDGKVGTLTYPDESKPFVTVASATAEQRWDWVEGSWVRGPSGP